MNEELQNSLRWVLLSPAAQWRAEFSRVLDPHSPTPELLAEVRDFLRTKLDVALPPHDTRMRDMIVFIDDRLGGGTAQSDHIREQAEAYIQLDGRVAALEAELARQRAALRQAEAEVLKALRDGESVEIGGYRLTRRAASESVVVDDPRAVPPVLCRLQPDERAIRLHHQQVGELPPGTRLARRAPSLDVLKLLG